MFKFPKLLSSEALLHGSSCQARLPKSQCQSLPVMSVVTACQCWTEWLRVDSGDSRASWARGPQRYLLAWGYDSSSSQPPAPDQRHRLGRRAAVQTSKFRLAADHWPVTGNSDSDRRRPLWLNLNLKAQAGSGGGPASLALAHHRQKSNLHVFLAQIFQNKILAPYCSKLDEAQWNQNSTEHDTDHATVMRNIRNFEPLLQCLLGKFITLDSRNAIERLVATACVLDFWKKLFTQKIWSHLGDSFRQPETIAARAQ